MKTGALAALTERNGNTDMSSNRDRITIDREGDWQKIVHILQPYQTPYGTIRVGDGPEGVLAFDKQLNGFVQILSHGTRPPTALNQRKVRAVLKLPEGRPRKGYEVRELVSVRLEPAIIEYLTELGEGNLAAGIMKVATEHRDGKGPVILFQNTSYRVLQDTKTVAFQVMVDGQVREVEVSFEALAERFGYKGENPNDIRRAMVAGREEIQEVTRRLLPSHLNTRLVLGVDDFEDLE